MIPEVFGVEGTLFFEMTSSNTGVYVMHYDHLEEIYYINIVADLFHFDMDPA